MTPSRWAFVAGNRRASRSPRATSAGFTLVELLVAAGITVLIASFVAAIVATVSKTWTRASGRLTTDAQARIVLDQLELDLQSALFRDDGNVWLAIDVNNNSNGLPGTPWQVAARNPKPVGGLSLDLAATRADLVPSERGKFEQTRYGSAGAWLRFFTTSRGSNTASNLTTVSAPVAVGYQIIRRFASTNPAQNPPAYAYFLHRAEARPTATGTGANARPGVLESGYNLTSAAYTTSTVGTNNGAQNGDPRTLQVVTTNPRNLDAVIADNVIDFGVRAYVRDPTRPGGLRLVFPATATGTVSNASSARLRGTLPPTVPPEQWNGAQPFPEVIDVMVRILTEQGATLIADIERIQTPPLPVPLKYNGNAQQWWWGVATENSRVYTRRIVVNAKST